MTICYDKKRLADRAHALAAIQWLSTAQIPFRIHEEERYLFVLTNRKNGDRCEDDAKERAEFHATYWFHS